MPKTTNQIPFRAVWQAQQRAQLRVQLYATGETHRILSEFTTTARGIVLAAAGSRDNLFDGLALYRAQSALVREWSKTFDQWKKFFNNTRKDSAQLPFETLLVYHDQMVKPAIAASQNEKVKSERAERLRTDSDLDLSWYWWSVDESESSIFNEAAPDGPNDVNFVFAPQLQAVLNAADQRVYKDGLRLSQRIWKLDHDSRNGINAVLYNGVAQQKSAWDIAKDLEGYLGASQDCPRWTSTRLYKLTKKDIAAGNRAGLRTGPECDGKGVAYNALRMARTELQAVHHIATQDVMDKMPWIEKEQVMLSKAHPVKDICDEKAEGGEDGKGIYPKGTTRLPFHPN